MNAIISEDGRYRYRLTRELGFTGQGALCFVMLNPSTADETNDDPTIRRCLGFAKAMNCARLEVVNLFAFRATDPLILRQLGRNEAIGPENDQHILNAVSRSRLVLCAWGNHGLLYGRDKEVASLVGTVTKPFALKINAKSGQPAHPLYLKGNLKPIPMTPAERAG